MTQVSSGERKEESQSALMSRLEEIQAALSGVPVAAQPLKEDWQIPVIDLALLHSPVERSVVIDQIRGACEDWGFFHVVNHGVPKDVIDGMWKAYDTLFQAPAEQRAIFDHCEPFLSPSLREKDSEKFLAMQKSFAKGVDFKDTICLHKFNPDDEDRMTHVPQECRQ
ncbi:hypothetical protein KP509_26G044800 [Ceratopteris richardii]|uniref:Non-haem dioxygenase N-terminal domain-containing protein n=1 Tax=Ceratopteris richardii TaxID=49495 RepID=A0A8T2RKJ7_CERRI|nr:hypothetical protein KP509_26G044800 [Ceratopteris richardii]